MATDWKAFLKENNAHGADLAKQQPEVIKGFGALKHAAMTPGALTIKEKERIAVSIAITKRCVDCIAHHVNAAVKAGVTRKELEETVAVCMLMDGGPAHAYGMKALDAFDAFSK